MEALEIFKIPGRDCLKRSNINWKAFSKKLITKETLYKTFPKHSFAFPETGSNFVTQTCANH